MKEKRRTTIDHEAVPIVAAETVVTRHLKIVDEYGNVRIDMEVCDSNADEAGPWIRLYGKDGSASVILSIDDAPDHLYLWFGNNDDCEVSLNVGGLKGAGIDVQGPTLRSGRGARLELLAENDVTFIAAHGQGERRTLLQLVPGEEMETFVKGADTT